MLGLAGIKTTVLTFNQAPSLKSSLWGTGLVESLLEKTIKGVTFLPKSVSNSIK